MSFRLCLQGSGGAAHASVTAISDLGGALSQRSGPSSSAASSVNHSSNGRERDAPAAACSSPLGGAGAGESNNQELVARLAQLDLGCGFY